MLTIKGGHDFSAVKIGKRDHLNFGKSIGLFDGFRNGPCFRFLDAAAQDGRYLDFDLDMVGPDDQLRNGPIGAAWGHVRSGNAAFDACSNAVHGGVDIRQGFGPWSHRQVGQIDIDRQARHVSDEEVDGGATLEGEALFRRDKGQGAYEKRHLFPVLVVKRHGRIPVL